jgi:hypothetical protein
MGKNGSKSGRMPELLDENAPVSGRESIASEAN